MSAENETLVRRFFDEFLNGRRAEVADEIVSESFVAYGPQAPPAEGMAAEKEHVGLYQQALDGRWEVGELFSAEDRVVARWVGSGTHVGELMGLRPTGREVAVDAISIFRLSDGKITEEWTVWDALGLL